MLSRNALSRTTVDELERLVGLLQTNDGGTPQYSEITSTEYHLVSDPKDPPGVSVPTVGYVHYTI